MNDFSSCPRVSVILPVHDEEECLPTVLDHVREVTRSLPDCEIIVSDDGSTDASPTFVKEKAAIDPRIFLLRNPINCGQSAAMYLAFQRATGEIIVTLDADGQNDPRDILTVVAPLLPNADGPAYDICCGYRASRKDTLSKRFASRFANAFRRLILHDHIIDTGCSLKAFRASFVKHLQYWNGLHRFLPMLCEVQGARITQCPVRHNPRLAGRSKYTNLGRLRTTWGDLFGVRWLRARSKDAVYVAACLQSMETRR